MGAVTSIQCDCVPDTADQAELKVFEPRSAEVRSRVEADAMVAQLTQRALKKLAASRSQEEMLMEMVEEARKLEHQQCEVEMRQRSTRCHATQLAATKLAMRQGPCSNIPDVNQTRNRYGANATLLPFEPGRHVPVLALINPLSGAGAGADILDVARRTAYYQERFFNIIDVVKSQKVRGGLLDVFRQELNAAKEEAKKLDTRARVISGGGDGTGSFTIFIIFLALKADNDRRDEGLGDTGNGFIWSDQELEECFPAVAQMPLGSANDFANILGWGQKYPGDISAFSKQAAALRALQRWVEAICDPKSRLVNFDVFGILPPAGAEACDFKLAELVGERGRCPNKGGELTLKKAGLPVPYLICLYFSSGIGAYLVSRFQINRHSTPLRNRAEYARQLAGIIAESTPPQLSERLDGVRIAAEGEAYFPPRQNTAAPARGCDYREVGFYNINWQGHLNHGYDRAPLAARLDPRSTRQPATFDDGLMDLFRGKVRSMLKNPTMQTDKRKDLHLSFDGGHGKGLFFQWDGEARFAFSPSGKAFEMYIRRVMSIPVVLGPEVDQKLIGNVDFERDVKFGFMGDSVEAREQSKHRLLQSLTGELAEELNATEEEIRAAGFSYSA